MANNRVFYAAKKVGLGPLGSAGGNDAEGNANGDQGSTETGGQFRQLHGIQSVGITTTFNLEQTFELGQLAIYENIEGIPDVSIDIEKVLDGYCPVYVLATSINGDGAGSTADDKSTAATLVGRSKARADFVMAIFKDTDLIADNLASATKSIVNNTTASGYVEQPESHVVCSGVYVNSVSYNVGIDGYATESVTLVGQDKIWYSLESTPNFKKAVWSNTDLINAEDQPKALTQGSGGANRREDVLFVYPGNNGRTLGSRDINGAVSGLGTVLPIQIPGISASGTNDKKRGVFGTHIQSFSCSTDLGREDIFELGRRGRYHRFVPFPTEVTCEITCISTSGDLIIATEEGAVDPANGANLLHESIRLHLREGLLVDLGKKNKLASVSVTGGDAGGGNEEITYSYTNFNDFTVYHPQDPNFKRPIGAATEGGTGLATYKSNTFTPRDGRCPGARTAHANI